VSQIQYGVAGGLSEVQISTLHQAALGVIENVGVQISNPTVLKKIKGQHGVRISGNRVYLKSDVIDGFVTEHRRQKKHESPRTLPTDTFKLHVLTGYCFKNIDPRTDQPCAMTTETCIQTAKLVDCLHNQGVVGGTPGMPQDVAPQLREILSYKIGCEFSRTAGIVGISSMKSAEYIYQMTRAAGKPFHFTAFALSPLRLEGEAFDMTLELIDKGYDIHVGISTMPLLGVTTPIYYPGASIENIATVLATYAVFRLMGITQDIGFQFGLFPFDLKTGSIAYGTPEHIISYLIGSQINRYYGGSSLHCQAFHTNALFPDAHAITQRASFGTIAALNGARDFCYGGLLGIDKIFSAEQLIIDLEIINYLRTLVRGFEFSARTMSIDAIREIGPGGEFITHPSTLEECRNQWTSRIFENVSPEQWEITDKRRLKERVGSLIEETGKRYDFSPDEGVRRELNSIYKAAVKELA
jgi:trimethylamine--corrinoid protein Co-methyltransferase